MFKDKKLKWQVIFFKNMSHTLKFLFLELNHQQKPT